MELTRDLLLSFCGGLLLSFCGGLLGWLTVKLLLSVFTRPRERAKRPPKGSRPKGRPPKGTRPEVRMKHDGIIYDVTEGLERRGDDEAGFAVWVVHGPAHVTVTAPPSMAIALPAPDQTSVAVHIVGDKFATAEEIDADYPPAP